MVSELEHDISRNALYISPRLSGIGRESYPTLLRTALQAGSDASLANDLRLAGRLNTHEERRKPSGGTTLAKVPVTAADTLAEGEFNRFYIRALCLRAMSEPDSTLVICRVKAVSAPRPESEALIGSTISPEQLLADLRNNPGIDTALGVPPGPNSGLTVQLVKPRRAEG